MGPVEAGSSGESGRSRSEGGKRFKGVRRRKWGKWVSEIRVPHTQERLWLGSYSTPEAAAVAHDTAVFFLRGPSSSSENLNFPDRIPPAAWASLSPSSIQRVASDSAMAVDAQFIGQKPEAVLERPVSMEDLEMPVWEDDDDGGCNSHELRGGGTLDISIDDMEICL